MVGIASYTDLEIEFVLRGVLDNKRHAMLQKEFRAKFGRSLSNNQIRYLKNKYGKDPKFSCALVNKRKYNNTVTTGRLLQVTTESTSSSEREGQGFNFAAPLSTHPAVDLKSDLLPLPLSSANIQSSVGLGIQRVAPVRSNNALFRSRQNAASQLAFPNQPLQLPQPAPTPMAMPMSDFSMPWTPASLTSQPFEEMGVSSFALDTSTFASNQFGLASDTSQFNNLDLFPPQPGQGDPSNVCNTSFTMDHSLTYNNLDTSSAPTQYGSGTTDQFIDAGVPTDLQFQDLDFSLPNWQLDLTSEPVPDSIFNPQLDAVNVSDQRVWNAQDQDWLSSLDVTVDFGTTADDANTTTIPSADPQPQDIGVKDGFIDPSLLLLNEPMSFADDPWSLDT